MNLLEGVPTLHHMSIKWESANVIKHILILRENANPDDIFVSVKM